MTLEFTLAIREHDMKGAIGIRMDLIDLLSKYNGLTVISREEPDILVDEDGTVVAEVIEKFTYIKGGLE